MTATTVTLDTPERAEIVEFLRRFSAIMTSGENSDNLMRAAFLIEDLMDELRNMQQQIEGADVKVAEYQLLHTTAEDKVASLTTNFNALNTKLAEEQARVKEALERSIRAEASLAVARTEMEALRAKLSGLGKTATIVPVDKLEQMRKLFASLAADFRKRGDIASEVMCEAGRQTVDQALAGIEAKAGEAA